MFWEHFTFPNNTYSKRKGCYNNHRRESKVSDPKLSYKIWNTQYFLLIFLWQPNLNSSVKIGRAFDNVLRPNLFKSWFGSARLTKRLHKKITKKPQKKINLFQKKKPTKKSLKNHKKLCSSSQHQCLWYTFISTFKTCD